jgi:hypothetical protein
VPQAVPRTDAAPIVANLLGPVHLAVGARVLADDAWPRQSARGLLLLLLATPGHRLPRDRTLELLWPTAQPEAARNALYKALHVLRRVLEPDLAAGRASAYLLAGAEAVGFRPDAPLILDVDAFEERLVEGGEARARGEQAAQRSLLRDALALYRGGSAGGGAGARLDGRPPRRVAPALAAGGPRPGGDGAWQRQSRSGAAAAGGAARCRRERRSRPPPRHAGPGGPGAGATRRCAATSTGASCSGTNWGWSRTRRPANWRRLCGLPPPGRRPPPRRLSLAGGRRFPPRPRPLVGREREVERALDLLWRPDVGW